MTRAEIISASSKLPTPCNIERFEQAVKKFLPDMDFQDYTEALEVTFDLQKFPLGEVLYLRNMLYLLRIWDDEATGAV